MQASGSRCISGQGASTRHGVASVQALVPPTPVVRNPYQPSVSGRGSVAAHAKRRVLDRDYSFVELYQVVGEKLRERNCLLVRDTYQLIECIKTPEQAARCLDIIAGYIQVQQQLLEAEDPTLATVGPQEPVSASDALELGSFARDWHHRKRFLARIAEIAALELNAPQMVLAIVANQQRFKLSTYFGKDLIKQLGSHTNVPLDFLSRVAGVVQQQRGPSDRGTKAAWMAVLEVAEDRGAAADTVASIKGMLAATRAAGKTGVPPPASAPAASAPVSAMA